MERNAEAKITRFNVGDEVIIEGRTHLLGNDVASALNIFLEIINAGCTQENLKSCEVSLNRGITYGEYAVYTPYDIFRCLGVDLRSVGN